MLLVACSLYTGRHPHGYWSQEQNLQRELEGFLSKWDGCASANGPQGSDRVMPRLGDLQRAGRYDLMGAVQMWGGVEAVAQSMGLRMSYAARHAPQLQL